MAKLPIGAMREALEVFQVVRLRSRDKFNGMFPAPKPVVIDRKNPSNSR
jgi:hypothetical protein